MDMAGGSPAVNAEITTRILSGEKGPRRDVVVVNAGAALTASGVAQDFREGIRMAEAAIDQGRALQKLQELVRFTGQMHG
jgi:anthranilate phosphoribosyltransferase